MFHLPDLPWTIAGSPHWASKVIKSKLAMCRKNIFQSNSSKAVHDTNCMFTRCQDLVIGTIYFMQANCFLFGT